jgi:hypothetical protein
MEGGGMASQHRWVDDTEFARVLMDALERTAHGLLRELRERGMVGESSTEQLITIPVAVPVEVRVRTNPGEQAAEICCTCIFEGDVFVCRGAGTRPCCSDS